METTEIPLSWRAKLTVADEMIVEALDERTRVAVERYVRSSSSVCATDLEEIADRIADEIRGDIDIGGAVKRALRRRAR